jgi:uncharacterized protein involved in outer membrane biogenesis
MRRALKFLFAFLGLVVVAVIAAVPLIPRGRIVALAADQVRVATGRDALRGGQRGGRGSLGAAAAIHT